MATKLLVTDVIEVRSKPNITVKQDGSSDVMSPQYEMSEVHNRNLVDDDSGTHLDNSSTEGNSQKKYALDDKNLLSPRVNTEEKRFISIPSPIDDNMDDAPEDMSPGLRTIADMKSFRDIATTMKNLERDLGMESINQEVKDEPNRLHFFVAEQGTSSQNTNQKTSRETSPISEDTYRKKRPSILKITDKKSDMKRSETTTTEKRSISSGAKKHWTKLSNVFRSLTLMKSLEVKNIGNSSQLFPEIRNFNVRKWKDNLFKTDKFDFAKETLEELRTTQLLCNCAAVGSVAHLRIIREIINKDPKKFLYETDDPSHLLNKSNMAGQNMMYIAAKNGNLSVVDFLHQKNANPLIKSLIDKEKKLYELPLEVAVKWNHIKIVEYLIENHDYDAAILNHIRKLCTCKQTTTMIDKHMVRRSLKRKFSVFGCVGK